MRALCLLLVMLFGLAACASGAGNPPPEPLNQTLWGEPERTAQDSGSRTIGIVGTPFYALAKGVGCVLSVVVATPVAIGLGLSTREDRDQVRANLDRGVGANCGGSYALAPF
jgi:hypothetical protein